MWEPRSIFTGNDTATALDSTQAQRSTDTGQDRESLVKTPNTPDPPYPLDPLSNLPDLLPPWTPKSPLAHRDWIKHLGSAPSLHGSRRDSGKLVASTPPATLGTKRPPPLFTNTPPASRHPDSASEPLHKRRKVLSRSRYALRHADFTKSAQFRHDNQPPSPLFFSSRSTRPQLPARFSSSEAAARMLSKTHEDSGIKTVTLARGTFSGLSPPGPPTGPGARSSERSSLARTASPDSRDKSDPLRLLGSVSIAELLEQDGRPTFIVDMGDFANYTPETSPLQILFANSALRSNPSTWELVAGKPADSPLENSTSHATQQFRGWLLSTTIPGENSDVNPPPVDHGGIVWSCYTLRRRLRVVSGLISAPAIVLPAVDAPNDFAIPSTPSADLVWGNNGEKNSSSAQNNEPQDYFGSTVPMVSRGEPTPPVSAPQPTPNSNLPKFGEDGSEAIPRPSKIGMPSIEDSSSFANECVLRAQTAGDVDSFRREVHSPHEDNQDMGFFDWTRLALSPSLPRHIQFARSIDWASTPLGPIEYWSNDLRAMCNLIM